MFFVLLSLSGIGLGGGSIMRGTMSKGGGDILHGRIDENGKILAVNQISGLSGGMMGQFVISRHDGGGGWLLGGCLLLEGMLLRIPVERLSCGFVVVNFVPN